MKEKFPNTRKLSHSTVCGQFLNLRWQHNQEEKKKNNTEYTPNCNCQERSSPEACLCHQRIGAGQGGVGCILRLRTRPECPEDNLRELTGYISPNCGINREKDKKRERERENFPVKH